MIDETIVSCLALRVDSLWRHSHTHLRLRRVSWAGSTSASEYFFLYSITECRLRSLTLICSAGTLPDTSSLTTDRTRWTRSRERRLTRRSARARKSGLERRAGVLILSVSQESDTRRTQDYANSRVVDFHTLNKPEEDMYDRAKVPRQPW